MKSIIKKILNVFGINPSEIKGKIKGGLRLNVAENVFHTKYDKNALLVYISEPFKNRKVNKHHPSTWQTLELARILSEFGYNVDAIPYFDHNVKLHRMYDFVLAQFPKDVDCYSDKLKADSVKVAYITTSSPRFNNDAEIKRIDELYYRRGVKTPPLRQLPEMTDDIYAYDAAFVMGNQRNIDTYDYLPKTYIINNASNNEILQDDFSLKDASNFLYLGSVGQVHKGLDILLDIFSEKDFPCTLYVCGAYEHEKEFYALYREELEKCPNIVPLGVVDTTAEQYNEVAKKCAYLIGPSCAEGKSGAVITAMRSGIIPIISKESGFDDDEAILLDDCSISCIRSTILKYSAKDENWIKEKGIYYRTIGEQRYSRDSFRQSVEKALKDVILDENK